MAYFLDLFSPQTYEAFSASGRDVSGFRLRQQKMAEKVKPGDTFVCYMTGLSRWAGLLEVLSKAFIDNTPIFDEEDDPFVVRFKVKVKAWLPREKAIPIHEQHVWSSLSITRQYDTSTPTWTGHLRTSLAKLSAEDGAFLEKEILAQASNGRIYEVDENVYRRFLARKIRRSDKTVAVVVPENESEAESTEVQPQRESAHYQSLLAGIGEKMGFKIWLPRGDRSRVLNEWKPADGVLLERLPLNYDETTLKTIEQIDVIWLKGRSIVRAFEIEHTTAVYSGILRMADLLALQPNMDIKLHIVAPESRREKVFQEIRRPVFSLLEKGPLAEYCTFIGYDALDALSSEKHLSHLSASVLEEYEEEPE